MKSFFGLLSFLFFVALQVPSAMAWASAHLEHTNTLVHTQDDQGQASLKPIAQLQVGGKVLAKSEWKAQGQNLSYEPITDILVTPAQPRRLVDLVLADGQKISTTDGHPFNTPEGWRDAILLKKGGKLLLKGDGESDKTVEIASVTHRTELQTTYNLEVANAHTFFVGEDGVLVHNGNGYVPPPDIDELPGFPGTERNRRYKHPTWTNKRRICQWYALHGGVEVFTAGSEDHLGGFDHETGERLPGKPGKPVPGRKVRK